MSPSFSALAASWQNFYLLIGAAAATLIGLMFVAITFGATMIEVKDANATRAFLDPTLGHFVQVLVTACVVVAPSPGRTIFGALVIAIGVLRLATLVRIQRHMRDAQRKNNDLELSDWMSGLVVPFAAYVVVTACGALFVAGRAPFGLLAATTVVVLLNGIYGAWELMVWLALARTRGQ